MLEKSILLQRTPNEAFRLFTERISAWWPQSHRPAKDPASVLFLEPDRFLERASDGREIQLGRVLSWEPPHRIALDFFIGTGPTQPTSVEITFKPEADGTRILVSHQSKPESEALWSLRAPTFEKSWETVLAAFLNR